MDLSEKALRKTKPEILCLLPEDPSLAQGGSILVWITNHEDRANVIFYFDQKGICSQINIEYIFDDIASLEKALYQKLDSIESSYGLDHKGAYTVGSSYSTSLMPFSSMTSYCFPLKERGSSNAIVVSANNQTLRLNVQFII